MPDTCTPKIISSVTSTNIQLVRLNVGAEGKTINLHASGHVVVQTGLSYTITSINTIVITVLTTGIMNGTVYHFNIDGTDITASQTLLTGSGPTWVELPNMKTAGGSESFKVDSASADDEQQSKALGAVVLGRDSVSLHITTKTVTGTPTNIKLYLDSSPDESTWFKHVDPDDVELAYLTTTSFTANDKRVVRFPLRSATWRVRMVNDSTDPASNYATFEIGIENHVPNTRIAI